MARQTGLLGIKGTVGGMTFDKNGVVRKAAQSNKAHFDGADSMARTRENAVEFGRAATAGKLLRQALRKQIQGTGDKVMISRLTRTMRTIESLDTVNPRGLRRVLKAHANLLVGFNFNTEAPLSTVFFAGFTVVVSAVGVVTLTLPTILPFSDLAAPTGATHYSLEMGLVVLDFDANISRVLVPTGIPAPAPINGQVVANIALTATLGAAPTATEVVVVVLGVNFFQQINAQLYPLNNGATNPLGVVYAG